MVGPGRIFSLLSLFEVNVGGSPVRTLVISLRNGSVDAKLQEGQLFEPHVGKRLWQVRVGSSLCPTKEPNAMASLS